jgi:fructuronate reductase
MPDSLPRLSRATVRDLRQGIEAPRLPEPDANRIVHLGLGAFARAHLAMYVEDCAAAQAGNAWEILGVSLQRPDQRDRLAPQDWLYTTLERWPDGSSARIIGGLTGVLVAPEDPNAVIAALVSPKTRIVTLTVTEKGYCHEPATGRLNLDHPDICHDLRMPEVPRTAVGFLVEGLRQRHAAGLSPFTVLSCDNLPGNGRLLAGLVEQFADVREPVLAGWIAQQATFPCCMVDRIVPAATEEDFREAARITGLTDAAVVSHEPFRQWVIEDRFVQGLRPSWELAGAIMTSNVEPFELMKLRLLNGAHSALAYLGYLAGRETVADAVTDPVLHKFLLWLWEEVIATVPCPPGVDLVAYTRELADRFRNPAVRHRTWQIAMDGSQKLPQRLLGPVRDRRARNLGVPCLSLVIAAWARYIGGIDETGKPIDVRDPLAASLRARLEAAGPDPAARIRALVAEEAIFGRDLPHDERFVAAVTAAYSTLLQSGAELAAAAAV